ncbi:hypothetical protein BU14_0222s0002 [Porphyra umbilicalis]|uniref:Uncharacterized protein n=1 Tax=Porphyra umbilicalis TaxID=2786 RepID=A0A1X6P4H7_PORUM|nr:hypothetical protein BU14_0222s0002 [Porphyra umbilicalis]|eukprot:OSX75757.1 hypothetical protein BU14_0222s0002 [Porphyra umbilicalis]
MVEALLAALCGNRDAGRDEGIEALYMLANIDVWGVGADTFFGPGKKMDLGQFERFRRVMITAPYASLVDASAVAVTSALRLEADTGGSPAVDAGGRDAPADPVPRSPPTAATPRPPRSPPPPGGGGGGSSGSGGGSGSGSSRSDGLPSAARPPSPPAVGAGAAAAAAAPGSAVFVFTLRRLPLGADRSWMVDSLTYEGDGGAGSPAALGGPGAGAR